MLIQNKFWTIETKTELTEREKTDVVTFLDVDLAKHYLMQRDHIITSFSIKEAVSETLDEFENEIAEMLIKQILFGMFKD